MESPLIQTFEEGVIHWALKRFIGEPDHRERFGAGLGNSSSGEAEVMLLNVAGKLGLAWGQIIWTANLRLPGSQ
jgi:hypothetical protein